jgi:acetyl/propionyl-CoA carboxylase alpha subunit/acetyl-CoA carboxylase carboxyltransferase component
MKLLIANRGEIAVRIMRAAAELGISTVAVFPKDDAASLHTRRADEARLLAGTGVNAYLDMDQIVSIAKETGCRMIHPGYGFLSENFAFARRCAEEDIQFVGPSADTLELFGDKARALALAAQLNVPVLPCERQAVTPNMAKAFFSSLGPGGAMMIKAVAGGGGRGMRAVYAAQEIDDAYTRCRSEAKQAFGIDDVYVEKLMPGARHVEVQIVGDGSGRVSHLYERECSIQRCHQKIIEIAPCPSLLPGLRDKLTADALKMAKQVNYANLGTFEFLVEADAGENASYAFIEANPRLQVEHTVTEEVMDLDLVKVQIQLALGKSLAELKLLQNDIPKPMGYALEVRVNMETMGTDGSLRPAGGTLKVFEAPSGRGVRTDTCGYVGFQTNPNFDSLLAKLIGHSRSPDFKDAVLRTYRALCEFKIEGVRTNLLFLQNILRHPDFISNRIHTCFVEDHMALLAAADSGAHPRLFVDQPSQAAVQVRAGAKVDNIDPLAVLSYGKAGETITGSHEATPPTADLPDYDMTGLEHTVVVTALMQGTIVSMDVVQGDLVHKDQQLLVMNAMKMEHVVRAPASGRVIRLGAEPGDTVYEGHPLVFIEEQDFNGACADGAKDFDPSAIRPDLAELLERQAVARDDARPEKVEKRRQRGQRTARKNIADLCDPGTFMEYGSLVIAAQRQRRTLEDLIENTPTDGLVAGIGRVNGDLFPEEKARCILMSYDYMVLAGTQGMQNHKKKDRMFELAEKWRLPVVFFTEGGGGRPGDTDAWGVAGLDCMAFHLFGKLSGLVPLIGVNSGRCFAGNAAILGCCDVVIATQNSSIGMGGPAMIEGGGLGVFKPDEVGPMKIQVPNGVVDIAVSDEAEAVSAARQYLSYFQGPVSRWECADQRLLRHIIPENRLRIYDTRAVIDLLADTGSVLELRRHFGLGMVTALIRIEGRPIGVIANNPSHLSGAIDAPAADKASRFMQVCDAYDIPILFLCDTPGIMVGPEVEKTALVRHCCRMFVTGGSLTVPYFTIVLRKSYGLGAQAMGGGSHKAPLFVVSWPTGEFGGMGLEGAVKLGFRKEIAAIDDPEERKKLFEHMVAKAYEHGKAINTASHFEIDDVIDPALSRHAIIRALNAVPPPLPRTQKKRPCIDTW